MMKKTFFSIVSISLALAACSGSIKEIPGSTDTTPADSSCVGESRARTCPDVGHRFVDVMAKHIAILATLHVRE